jgi:LSD1 subclass zinc finger protein
VAQWARLQEPARCGLRWGAWYPVMGLTPREARLWVRGRAMVVARSLLELRDTLPREWTVARPPGEADPYLVCPSCRHRARLPDGGVTTLRCARCNELFTIAWDNDSGEPSRDQLRADRRMARRRIPRDRRTSDERRTVERRALGWAALPVERRLTERRAIALRRSGWERRGMVERRRRAVAW